MTSEIVGQSTAICSNGEKSCLLFGPKDEIDFCRFDNLHAVRVVCSESRFRRFKSGSRSTGLQSGVRSMPLNAIMLQKIDDALVLGVISFWILSPPTEHLPYPSPF